MGTTEQIRRKYQLLRPLFTERQRRLWAAAEALTLGRGGPTRVAEGTGLNPRTIRAGIDELRRREAGDADPLGPGRDRLPGGGRKPLTDDDPAVLTDLEALIDPLSRGDPMSPLRWTCKSTAKPAAALRDRGHRVSPRTVAQLLAGLGYSLPGTHKAREGHGHPDRNAQFEYPNATAAQFQRRRLPVVSVDAKKKELVGDFHQKGREWRPAGRPEAVRVHDFPDPGLGEAIPYGVYDLTANAGWVSVGVDHDTAEFAVESLRRWWRLMGRAAYPGATELLVAADGGGSNGSRNRLWTVALQRLADESGLRITVRHYPPGTSKWNKIEHRMFCHITANRRGRPLTSREVVVSLIGATTTAAGLSIRAGLDTAAYPTGVKVSDEEMAALHLQRADFHGDWNYTIIPRAKQAS